MYRLISKLVIYRNAGEDSILFRLADICQQFDAGGYIKENLITEIYIEINRLLDIATCYGFDKKREEISYFYYNIYIWVYISYMHVVVKK